MGGDLPGEKKAKKGGVRPNIQNLTTSDLLAGHRQRALGSLIGLKLDERKSGLTLGTARDARRHNVTAKPEEAPKFGLLDLGKRSTGQGKTRPNTT